MTLTRLLSGGTGLEGRGKGGTDPLEAAHECCSWPRKTVAVADPKPAELLHHAEEVGWSLVSMCKHLLQSAVADTKGQADISQAGFDGALLHARALVEFLWKPHGSHIRADQFCSDWNGGQEAQQIGFNVEGLYEELNIHAAHLSRQRWKKTPAAGWDLYPHADKILELCGRLIDCHGVACRQELYEQLSEARVQLGRVQGARGLPSTT